MIQANIPSTAKSVGMQAAPVEPLSELEYLANQVDGSIQENQGLVAQLVDALHPVSKPVPPSASGSVGGNLPSDEMLSPIGHRHRNQRDQLDNINSRLREILKNLAV